MLPRMLHLAHFVRDDRDLLKLEHPVQRRRSAGVITLPPTTRAFVAGRVAGLER
jgi:hypothetical protein